MINVQAFSNPKQYTSTADIEQSLACCCKTIKHVTGHSTALVKVSMDDTIDKMKRCGMWKFKTKQIFSKPLQELENYYKTLKHSCFFNIANIADKDRRKYRDDIKSSDLFQSWRDMGDYGIGDYREKGCYPILAVIENKYKIKLKEKGITKNADIIAAAITTLVAIELSYESFFEVCRQLSLEYGIPQSLILQQHSEFNTERIMLSWSEALKGIFPDCESFAVESIKDKNITISVGQLKERFGESLENVDSIRKAVEESSSLFKTKGFLKKELIKINELQTEIDKQISA